MTLPAYSTEFYRLYAEQYALVAHEWRQSVYIKSSHSGLRNDWDALEHLRSLSPGKDALDAGCGAGARDVHQLWSQCYNVVGFDAIEENILVARELHPQIADRVLVGSLAETLPFGDASFDFAMCNAVIQHIDPGLVHRVALPELARVLRPGGVLQLMFKHGKGLLTVFDKDYGVERSFQLYDEHELMDTLRLWGMALVERESPEQLGGLLYFTDGKSVDHCLGFFRKGSSPS
jgi:ubiquinone/menaquinone biosynthesis C-methylase UbiE